MFSLVAVSAELAEQLVAVEAGGDDAVHQARTRVRRLRSILSVYGRPFDADAVASLRERLKVFGGRLGDVRDLEVRATAIEDTLGAETAPEVIDVVMAMAADARERYEAASRRLIRILHSTSTRRLLADVLVFAAEPPLRGRGRKHPRKLARKALAKAARKARTTGASLEQRHATRKAARRLRYAADAVADLFGRDAVRLSTAAEAVQDALGDHRDLVLLAAHLRAEARARGLTGSAAVGVEELAVACEDRADEALEGIEDRLAAIAHAA